MELERYWKTYIQHVYIESVLYRYLIQKTTYWKTNSKRYILNNKKTLLRIIAEMAAAMFLIILCFIACNISIVQ